MCFKSHVINGICMMKNRVIINRDRCIDCGISTGQCPTHAKTLSQLLSQNRKDMSVGVFAEDIYIQVKKLAEACPVKAIIIEKME
jgi:ferredoxin